METESSDETQGPRADLLKVSRAQGSLLFLLRQFVALVLMWAGCGRGEVSLRAKK